ncbi:MAG: glycosyltransferase family 4 protein, partial [Vreelandella alkaliphila]|uniref:glycosyltransferase family 4 protein n=1 Tax=Vreelandella alkaliphila TaxID=272774 RepID=UPI003F952F6A
MKIIFICKRYYTGKDVIRHSFGRLYEFPTQLAQLGHQLVVFCLDYRNVDPYEEFIEQFGAGSVRWIIFSPRNIYTAKVRQAYQDIKADAPGVIIGSSDIPCLWLARRLSRQIGVPYIVDLYDNYESFGQARIPFFRRILKACINEASIVITVSTVLKNKILSDYVPQGIVLLMNNGFAHRSFFVGDKMTARNDLGLPTDMTLIGTAGNLSLMKGLDTVYEAWEQIEKQTGNVCLVLAGRVESGFPVPDGGRVIYLGELLEEQVGQLFRSLDVGIIPAHDSEFGRYCFPQKLHEMVACGLPVIAANFGSIAQNLIEKPKILYTPGDAERLFEA